MRVKTKTTHHAACRKENSTRKPKFLDQIFSRYDKQFREIDKAFVEMIVDDRMPIVMSLSENRVRRKKSEEKFPDSVSSGPLKSAEPK